MKTVCVSTHEIIVTSTSLFTGVSMKALAIAILVVTQFAAHVQAQPLSCDMQNMLITTAAILRDQGRSKSDVRAALMKGGDLTKSEVNAILEVVYVTLRSSTPSKISELHKISCR